MEEVVFVTHNKGKIAYAQTKLKDINLTIYEYDINEPRSDDIKYISKYKVLEAYKLVNKPCISQDSGFWIDELNGFPKAFVNFCLETIGIKGILKLMEGKKNRNCRFIECLSFYDGKNLYQFDGKHEGTLSEEIKGKNSDNKWSDLWYIFKPYGYNITLAQMKYDEISNIVSKNSVSSIEIFADWYKKNRNIKKNKSG